MLKGSFDAQLIFLSELNMRFDVTACACDLDQYPNSIYNTTDHFFLFSCPMIIVIFFFYLRKMAKSKILFYSKQQYI